ncbi:hypothetical protein JYQ62_18620 [Nostoc sp. UHCC 0702]|nr:hypothetical protein JYQ62_18620 [Nostoc sp. UHCC 0702]
MTLPSIPDRKHLHTTRDRCPCSLLSTYVLYVDAFALGYTPGWLHLILV